MLLLISAHEALGTLEGLVRFAPNASALRILLLKKDACCSLQIDNRGISFYEMMQLTSAEQNRYDIVADTIMVYEAYIEKPFAISMLLFKAGFRAAPFLCISDFLLQNTEAYFSQLSSTQRNGDYLSWIKFILGGFTSAAK